MREILFKRTDKQVDSLACQFTQHRLIAVLNRSGEAQRVFSISSDAGPKSLVLKLQHYLKKRRIKLGELIWVLNESQYQCLPIDPDITEKIAVHEAVSDQIDISFSEMLYDTVATGDCYPNKSYICLSQKSKLTEVARYFDIYIHPPSIVTIPEVSVLNLVNAAYTSEGMLAYFNWQQNGCQLLLIQGKQLQGIFRLPNSATVRKKLDDDSVLERFALEANRFVEMCVGKQVGDSQLVYGFNAASPVQKLMQYLAVDRATVSLDLNLPTAEGLDDLPDLKQGIISLAGVFHG